jgi:hypothetical protein
LLVNGHFAAAASLVEHLQFEQLSLAKSVSMIGEAINVADHEQVAAISTEPVKAMQLQLLQKQCQAYYEMTLLIRAIVALDVWRTTEHEYAR